MAHELPNAWEQFQVPSTQLVPSTGAIFTFVTLQGRQNVLQTFTLASRDNVHG